MADEAFASSHTLESLEELRVKFLGKKGELTAVMKGMGALSPDERPVM
ncbi:MAG: phenylalanine--tRNA ligase subunit alpha, partial [Monoglobaceae bacterium]